MSWSDRPSRRAVLAAALVLPGCGFAPVYAPGGAGAALDGRVAITAPQTVEGYRLLTRLEDRLGRATAAAWQLTVTMDLGEEAAAVSGDGVIARYDLPGRAGFRLTDVATGAEVAAGEVRAFTGFAATGSTVATRAAETDARDRLAVMLADEIVTRLLALPGLT